MATMNKKRGTVTMKKDTRKAVNHEGSLVHKLDTLEILFSKVLGSFFGESTYYEKRTAEKDFREIQKLIKDIPDEDVEYALKVARIGREYNMIQFPLAVLTACFNDERFKGEKFVDEKTGRNKLQTYTDYIVRRGKDILDVIAMQTSVYGFDSTKKGRNKPLPMQLRKSLRTKLESFNEYQLSKALGENKAVSLADCIKLLHPNPSNSRVSENFFKNVIEGNVVMGASEETKQVQAELSKSKNKNNKSTKADVKKSIDTSTVMAIVKNLVALHKAGMFDDRNAVDSICKKLTNEKEVQKSRLLPFRFYSAYKEIEKLPNSYGKRRILDALVDALDLSIDNLQDIEGYSAILIDRSGSMNYPVSGASNVTADVVACMLGAICFKKGIADVYVFANECKQVTNISKKSTVMDIMNTISNVYVGGGTYLDVALHVIGSQKTKYDNLIVLTDNDCYSSRGNSFSFRSSMYWGNRYDTDAELNKLFEKKVIKKMYLDNLLGNTFSIMNTDDFRKNLITGFSERVIDVINTYSSIGSDATDVRKIIDSIVEKLPTR